MNESGIKQRLRDLGFRGPLTWETGTVTVNITTASKREMTDLELTKLCAEAMEYSFGTTASLCFAEIDSGKSVAYDPLHDDAQALALVKRFHLPIGWTDSEWAVFDKDDRRFTLDADLNRAIVKCVAKMQQAKCTP